MTRRYVLLTLLLLVPQRALAATFLLTWEFDRASPTQPDAFYITATNLATHQEDHLKVAPSTRAACGTHAELTDDSFCAVWPDCPADGVYALTIQAGVGEQRSADADQPLVCQFSGTRPCECLPVKTDAALPLLANTPGAAAGRGTAAGPAPVPGGSTPTTGVSQSGTQGVPMMPTFPTLQARGAT